VSRGLVQLAMALVYAWGLTVLDPSMSHAAEPERSVIRVGFVGPESPSSAPPGVNAFWERLRELGYAEGQNLVIEERWAEGRYDRLPALMAEVLGRNVDVLVTYTTPAGIAARNATSRIPIVDALMGDPVGAGLVASLARPGGNVTGLSQAWADIAGKWLELLQETIPRLSTVAVIENPGNASSRGTVKELEATAPTRGLKLRFIEVRSPDALDRAFEQAGRNAQAVLLVPDSMIATNRARIAALAAKHRLPIMGFDRAFVDGGGLMAYAPNMTIQFGRAADYVDKILEGARPAELPIEQPTQFSLVVNLKTAKALGLTIPESILLRADEVIR
jgi:putative tryptophan/tyrosine transport system substrate-binding protein